MKRILFQLFALLIFSAYTTNAQQTIKLYVGTFTAGESEGIYLCDFDANSGELTPGKIFKGIDNPNFLKISPDKKYLYAVMDELIKFDMSTGETLKAVTVDKGTYYALSMTADGKKIYAGPAGADISVYDSETLERLSVIPLAGDGVIAHRLTKN